MRIALFQPDIAQNVGAILRLGACLGVPVDVIEPCGFLWDLARIRRAGLDYMDMAELVRHSSWEAFLAVPPSGRLVLLTTAAEHSHLDFAFEDRDVLLFGRESAGVPPAVHQRATARIKVPLRSGARSLNLAMTAALVLGEALRQTTGFPQQQEGS